MKTKQKRAERAKLIADARALTDAVKEGETMSAEKNAEFDKLMKKADELKAEIDRLELLDSAEIDLGETVQRRAGRENISTDEAKARIEDENKACNAYLRNGMGGVPEELLPLARKQFKAAQSGELGGAGGYLVPPSFDTRVIEAQLAYGPMLMPGLCFGFDTATGNPMNFVTDNDTSNEGTIIGENATVGQQDVTFGQVTIDGYTFSSKMVLVPNSLLQDSAVDLEGYLAKKFGERIGRAKNRYYTLGDGAKKPTGIVTASTQGKIAASATVIAPDEVIELEHSVDPAYRANARYMFHDDVLLHLRKKKDGQGRYLWQEGLKAGAPDTINNKPYVINQHMATHATGEKAMLYGDFQSYYIRRIGGVRVLRLVERFADSDQTAFLAFERGDGNLIDAGTHPVKHLVMA
ncbi:phage major capsid protein [Reyranella sp.]|uniref:phage major capsid protein n=1 Tax=Reyranella sp. TaxID=1929291 RepID=UPI0027321184|nr:phage major capsid protein [Reyranella sp.]MDP2377777.1 phage major capsid protein [Reyranella sp.]